MKKTTWYASLLIASGLASCSQTVAPRAGADEGGACISLDSALCAGTMCTMDYRTLTVVVQDAAGNPAALDSAVTVDPSGRRYRLPENATRDGGGSYVILTDAWVSGHWNTTCNLRFLGYRGGRAVVSEPYVVRASCCHIEKVSGPASVRMKG